MVAERPVSFWPKKKPSFRCVHLMSESESKEDESDIAFVFADVNKHSSHIDNYVHIR